MKPTYLTILLSIVILLSCSRFGPDDSETKRQLLATADSLYQAGEYSEAVVPVMRVSELARKDDDHYLSGQAEDQLANIIAATYGGPEAVKHRLKAADHYLKADSIRAHRYAMIDVAIAYANNDSLRRCLEVLDSINSVPEDSTLMVNCLRARLRVSMMKSGLGCQHSDVEFLKAHRHLFTPSPADYIMFAISESRVPVMAARYRTFDPETAEKILSESTGYQLYLDSAQVLAGNARDKLLIEWATAECYRNIGQTERWKQYTDSIKHARLYENAKADANYPVVSAQRDFQTDRADSQEQRASSLLIIIVCIIAVAIIALASGVIYYRMSMRMKNAEIEAQMESLANLSKEISRGRSEIPVLNSRIEGLFRERWQTINFLCNEFFEKGDSEKTRTFIINEVEKEIQRLKTPRKLRQIEDSVNDCMDSIVCRLREQCPSLKEDDIVFLTLIYAGFSPRAVCMFTGIKLKSFYTKRTRLTARISASDAPDREFFLQRLNTIG